MEIVSRADSSLRTSYRAITAVHTAPIPVTVALAAPALRQGRLDGSPLMKLSSSEVHLRESHAADRGASLVTRHAVDTVDEEPKSTKLEENDLEARMNPLDLTKAVQKAASQLPDTQAGGHPDNRLRTVLGATYPFERAVIDTRRPKKAVSSFAVSVPTKFFWL